MELVCGRIEEKAALSGTLTFRGQLRCPSPNLDKK